MTIQQRVDEILSRFCADVFACEIDEARSRVTFICKPIDQGRRVIINNRVNVDGDISVYFFTDGSASRPSGIVIEQMRVATRPPGLVSKEWLWCQAYHREWKRFAPQGLLEK